MCVRVRVWYTPSLLFRNRWPHWPAGTHLLQGGGPRHAPENSPNLRFVAVQVRVCVPVREVADECVCLRFYNDFVTILIDNLEQHQ